MLIVECACVCVAVLMIGVFESRRVCVLSSACRRISALRPIVHEEHLTVSLNEALESGSQNVVSENVAVTIEHVVIKCKRS